MLALSWIVLLFFPSFFKSLVLEEYTAQDLDWLIRWCFYEDRYPGCEQGGKEAKQVKRSLLAGCSCPDIQITTRSWEAGWVGWDYGVWH